MSKYRVYLSTGASMTVTVEVDDDLDPDDAIEQAIEKAFDEAPQGVCAQCSGWGQSWGLDLGEWDIERDPDGKEATPELVED
jgi:hypothetical protein